jgi:hypothetical protein
MATVTKTNRLQRQQQRVRPPVLKLDAEKVLESTDNSTEKTIDVNITQKRILMESPLLGEAECIHNRKEEVGTTTGTCHQIQNND